jgi:hypothetical protein
MELVNPYTFMDVLTRWVRAQLCKLQKRVHSSCLPMVGGSLRVLRLLPPLKLVAMK